MEQEDFPIEDIFFLLKILQIIEFVLRLIKRIPVKKTTAICDRYKLGNGKYNIKIINKVAQIGNKLGALLKLILLCLQIKKVITPIEISQNLVAIEKQAIALFVE